jgi:hypothetical protein
MVPLSTSSTTAAWIAAIAAPVAVVISVVALLYARREANATAASAKSAKDSADEARRGNELAERAEQRALAATEVNRYRWEIVYYEGEAYRLFNLGIDIAYDVTMTVNYPDECLLDIPTDATIAPHDWRKFRISPSLAPDLPDHVLVRWRGSIPSRYAFRYPRRARPPLKRIRARAAPNENEPRT